MVGSQTFPIRYDTFGRLVLGLVGAGPRRSGVDVSDDEVAVRLGWAFRAHFPRAAVVSAAPMTRRTLNRGAHGWRHRWLVNGSSRGLVEIVLERRVRAWVALYPIRVGVVMVGVEEPAGLVAALGA